MNVVSGNGVTQAVKAAGKSGKVKLVEFDAGPPAGTGAQGRNDRRPHRPVPVRDRAAGRVRLAYQYVTGHKAGIAKHYGTGSAIITRANVNNPAYKKYLYTP